MFNDALNRLHLVDWGWLSSLLKSKEVADKDGALLLVNNLCPILKLIVVALMGGQLQLSDGLWVPGMLDTILAPSKLTLIL